jgi:alpha-glucosidase
VLGDNPVISSSKTEKVNASINAINYIKAIVSHEYNQLTLNCRGDYGIIFRAYNDAVAYRFTKRKTALS